MKKTNLIDFNILAVISSWQGQPRNLSPKIHIATPCRTEHNHHKIGHETTLSQLIAIPVNTCLTPLNICGCPES